MEYVKLYNFDRTSALPYRYDVRRDDNGLLIIQNEMPQRDGSNPPDFHVQENVLFRGRPLGSGSCGIMEPRGWIAVVETDAPQIDGVFIQTVGDDTDQTQRTQEQQYAFLAEKHVDMPSPGVESRLLQEIARLHGDLAAAHDTFIKIQYLAESLTDGSDSVLSEIVEISRKAWQSI